MTASPPLWDIEFPFFLLPHFTHLWAPFFLSNRNFSPLNMAAPAVEGSIVVPVAVVAPATSSQLQTLDEPVATTIMRDLKRVATKLRYVLVPSDAQSDTLTELRNWDLWGPLLLCLALSIMLSLRAQEGQTSLVFASVFVIVWAGSGVVTLNAALLGGNISFFQSVCVLGYCIFPLVLASVLCRLWYNAYWRTFVVAGALVWSTRGERWRLFRCCLSRASGREDSAMVAVAASTEQPWQPALSRLRFLSHHRKPRRFPFRLVFCFLTSFYCFAHRMCFLLFPSPFPLSLHTQLSANYSALFSDYPAAAATTASVVFMGELVSPQRRALAVYPTLLFYIVIAWLVFMQ